MNNKVIFIIGMIFWLIIWVVKFICYVLLYMFFMLEGIDRIIKLSIEDKIIIIFIIIRVLVVIEEYWWIFVVFMGFYWVFSYSLLEIVD